VTPHNNPQREEQRSSSLRRSIVMAVFILAMGSYFLLPLFIRTQTVQDVSLPDIVTAIEAGEVETLVVRGDSLVATKFD
jgi:hypothetical protein